jgi:hypothetical protein
MRKVFILAVTCVTLVVAVILVLLHYSPLCGEEVIMEKTSPDGRYVAALMRRNCGATTPYVAHINLRRATTQLQPNFFFGTIKGGEIWGSSKYSGDRFCWSGPRRLEIGYPPEDSLSHHEAWLDVTIGEDYRNPQCH